MKAERKEEKMMINDRVLYRNLEHQQLFDDMAWLMGRADGGQMEEGDRDRLYSLVNGLAELAGSHGFRGNIWHSYLAYELANHENAFSTACEVKGRVEGSINTLACHDFRIFKKMFDYPLEKIDQACHTEVMSVITTMLASMRTARCSTSGSGTGSRN